MSYTIQNYFVVMTKLDEYFFNHQHLDKATTLSIKAPKVAPLGLGGINHVSLTLRTDRMPLLTTLNLDNIFASQDLVDILVVHKDTLEELSLKTCYADPIPHYITERNENRIYWAYIFTSLFSACSEKLRRLALVGCEMLFPSGQKLAEEQISEEESKKVRSILQQDPGRMFFAYAYLDGSEETLTYDNKVGFDQVLKGEDQGSWDRLMGLVERNAETATKQSRGVQLQVES